MNTSNLLCCKKRMSSALSVLVLSCLVYVGTPSEAHADWLDKAKSLLGLGTGDNQAILGDEQIAEGLKQALSVGTRTVTSALAEPGGFGSDEQLRIAMPDSMQGVNKVLKKMGLGRWTQQLEDKLNQAAEKAAPEAAPVLLDAIANMKLEDIQGLYNGEADGMTRYFQKHMAAPIGDAMIPIIKQSLGEVEALKTYQSMMEKYQSVPFVSQVDVDLVGWVKDNALAGIFDNLAKEEAAIRQDPAKQSTELLKKLFGKG